MSTQSCASDRDAGQTGGQPRKLAPRFNIAPTTPIEVIRASEAGNELVPMYWGLVPSWWKKPLKELPATFNARAETLAERPMFRGAFKYRRCIIPASGFYEWTGAKRAKTPHYFTSRDGRPLGLAGITTQLIGPAMLSKVIEQSVTGPQH